MTEGLQARPLREKIAYAIAAALQRGFDDFVGDTGCIPEEFKWHGGNGVMGAEFSPFGLADWVAQALLESAEFSIVARGDTPPAPELMRERVAQAEQRIGRGDRPLPDAPESLRERLAAGPRGVTPDPAHDDDDTREGPIHDAINRATPDPQTADEEVST